MGVQRRPWDQMAWGAMRMIWIIKLHSSCGFSPSPQILEAVRLAHQRDGDCAVEQAVVEAIGEEGYYALEDCAREGQCHFVEAQADWLRQRQAGRQSDW